VKEEHEGSEREREIETRQFEFSSRNQGVEEEEAAEERNGKKK